ncbi:MAG: hypothetical protein IJT41_07510 [Clostridia bacterium]|nr:hypothetical protein [Clostridia bacterium]
MRQEIIDLSAEQRVGHGTRYIGTVGEHNATELVLTVPSELLKAAEYAVVLFDVGDTVFRSGKIPVKGRKKTPPAPAGETVGAERCSEGLSHQTLSEKQKQSLSHAIA